LGGLLAETADEQGNPYRLDSLFEFSPNTLSVTIPLRGAQGDLLRRTVFPVLSKSNVVYEADDGSQFASIIDVLQELSDTFEWILSEQN
jgi:hypothetical protein